MQCMTTGRLIRGGVAFIAASALAVVTVWPVAPESWNLSVSTTAWAQDEPQGGEESAIEEAPEVSAEEDVAPTQEDVALAQQIHDLLELRDREAMADLASMSQKVADELDPMQTIYRDNVSAIFTEFARCTVDPIPTDPTMLAAQCGACREKANAEVTNKLQTPWAQMEDRYIKLQADIDARVDQFEAVRDEVRLVFGLEAGDPIDQTVDQAVAQRAAVLRAFKPREFFEASYGQMSPLAVTSALICPLA